MSRHKHSSRKAGTDKKSQIPIPVSARKPYEMAEELVEKMKGMNAEARIAELKIIAREPMALAWVVIKYKDNTDGVRLEAVRMIGADISALKEIAWRTGGSSGKIVREAAIARLAELSEKSNDKEVLGIVAVYSSDEEKRVLAARKLIEQMELRELSLVATYSRFSDSAGIAFDYLVRRRKYDEVQSVAMFGMGKVNYKLAVDWLAKNEFFDYLMHIAMSRQKSDNACYAMDAAVRFGSERILAYFDERRERDYCYVFDNGTAKLAQFEHFEPIRPIASRYYEIRDNFGDVNGYSIVIVGILKTNDWDPENLAKPGLRAARLMYRMFRVRPNFEEDDRNPRMGWEINEKLRRTLELAEEQTKDLEYPVK